MVQVCNSQHEIRYLIYAECNAWVWRIFFFFNFTKNYLYLTHKWWTHAPPCSQGLVDPTNTNIVETSTCLETPQQERNFTIRLLTRWPWSTFSHTPKCSRRKLIVEVLGHLIDAKISPKQLSKVTDSGVWKYTHSSQGWFLTIFRMLILSLLARTANYVWWAWLGQLT